MTVLSEKLRSLQSELNEIFLERADAVESMLLAVLSKEHWFALGPPGTSKSLMVRTLVESILGVRYFETLLSKHRPPEAVLGPLDIKEFRENGNYLLQREGFATTADMIFLDEVGKASPILGHDLLALLNERIYHEVSDGNSAHAAPLMTAFTASNELITDESDDSAALWDRLLFRVLVDYVETDESFKALVTKQMQQTTVSIDFAELKTAIEKDVPSIVVPEAAMEALLSLRNGLSKAKIFPSDRRWRQSVRAMQASAYLDGRTEVMVSDVNALRFCLWDTAAQVEQVHRTCREVSDPWASQIIALEDAVTEQADELHQRRLNQNASAVDNSNWARGALSKLRKAIAELTTVQISAQKDVFGIDGLKRDIRALIITIMTEVLSTAHEAAESYADNELKGLL